MKIYTKTGDKGETSLLGGVRVSKADERIEAYGTVDELNASLGVVRSHNGEEDLEKILSTIQRDLFQIGSELAQSEKYKPKKQAAHFRPISEENVKTLEEWIDESEEELPELRSFILPGGSKAGAAFHLSRCICRRAERRVIATAGESEVRLEIITYLNRLSDLLFVLARVANHRAGIEDLKWED